MNLNDRVKTHDMVIVMEDLIPLSTQELLSVSSMDELEQSSNLIHGQVTSATKDKLSTKTHAWDVKNLRFLFTIRSKDGETTIHIFNDTSNK